MAAEVNYNGKFLWSICLVAAMGGLLFGYDWVVVGGAKPFYEPYFGIGDSTPFWRGWAQSSALFGCLIGALISGMLSDRFGRRRLLILAGFLFTASAIGTGLAWSFAAFNSFRILGGLGIGLASNLSPMYIAEISPAHVRGRFVSINQLTIVIGILLAQITNLGISQPVPTPEELRAHFGGSETQYSHLDAQGVDAVSETFPKKAGGTAEASDNALVSTYIRPTWNGQRGWRWMFGAETVPAFLFFLLMFFVPESPRWLVKYNRSEEAEGILERVGGRKYAAAEVMDIQATLAEEELSQVRFSDLFEPKLMKIVGLGMFLAFFQQWCGINVIFNYAQEVFAAAGYGVSGMMFNVVISGIVNFLLTIVAILTVDRIGRRPLLLVGSAGLAGIYAILGTGFYLGSTGIHMLVLVIAAIGCYAMTLAPIVWVIIAEIFPNRIRGAAMSVAVFTLWMGCTLLTQTFPYLNRALGAHGAFWTFGAVCVIGFVVILKKLPETKGKSLEDIERELVD